MCNSNKNLKTSFKKKKKILAKRTTLPSPVVARATVNGLSLSLSERHGFRLSPTSSPPRIRGLCDQSCRKCSKSCHRPRCSCERCGPSCCSCSSSASQSAGAIDERQPTPILYMGRKFALASPLLLRCDRHHCSDSTDPDLPCIRVGPYGYICNTRLNSFFMPANVQRDIHMCRYVA
ncbi:hypothetical protein PUN28_000226 [Cardiocondyla obscurior]|uniref:Uncharacterized protein n=1 Tax=Cardiocondyla obscurior TaxID=286306 RepID=A0AAW2GYA4_9HYME